MPTPTRDAAIPMLRMEPLHATRVVMTDPVQQGSFWRRRVVAPIVGQLRQGITPESIALTIALGTVIGAFPIMGATTLLCVLTAFVLRLNQPIMQLMNYVTYPLQLVMLIPFYRAGEYLGAPHLELSIPQLVERFQAGVWQFILDFGLIALGGVAVWCLVAPPVAVVLYYALRGPLRKLSARSAAAQIRQSNA